jgi:hypothetical protein
MSNPESHQILAMRDPTSIASFDADQAQWRPVVGSGERCVPGDEDRCGDGGLARDAKLMYPKGK